MTADWTITPVALGELSKVPRDAVYLNDSRSGDLTMPLIMFVLQSEGRVVLVDTGGPADADLVRRAIPFDYSVGSEQRLAHVLDQIGVRATEVDLIVNTHLHWDHCSNNDAFPNAEIVVQEAEIAYAESPVETQRRAYGYGFDGGPPFWRSRARMRAVDGELDVAPGLRVIPLAGHSPGSQGVRVTTGDGTYVITGDCVDTYANWSERGTLEPRPSGRFTDLSALRGSLDRLRGTGWSPLPSHDPEVVSMGPIVGGRSEDTPGPRADGLGTGEHVSCSARPTRASR